MQLNYYRIQQLFALLNYVFSFLNMPRYFRFHISHIAWRIIWKLIIVEAVNNPLMSYIRLCNYVKLNSDKPIKVAHLQKLANQTILNGALVIEKCLNNSFSESKKNVCRLIKLWTSIKCISTSISQLFRMYKADIRKKEVCFKSFIKTSVIIV